MTKFTPNRPRVGVSACLLGQQVRYDGGHKREPLLADELSQVVEWVSVCPEVEIGLGTPREPIELTAIAGGVRLMTVETRHDLTERMRSYVQRRVEELSRLGLCGFVLKSKSPSCGLTTTLVYGADGRVTAIGPGMFAAGLREHWPDLPIEEEHRLRDPAVREAFLARVFTYHAAQG